jgi:hypothetical protein
MIFFSFIQTYLFIKNDKKVIRLSTLLEDLSPDIRKLVGKVVLGDPKQVSDKDVQRKLAKLQDLPASSMSEPNTKWEQALQSNLEQWVDESGTALANFFKKNLDIFKKLAKQYPKIFRPPIGEMAYRGTIFSTKAIVEVLAKQKVVQIEKIKGVDYVFVKDVVYKPKSASQSWTTNVEVATLFGSTITPKQCSTILAGKVDDSFIFSPEFLSVITDGANEEEIVRVAKEGRFNAYARLQDLARGSKVKFTADKEEEFKSFLVKYNKYVDKANKEIAEFVKASGEKNIRTAVERAQVDMLDFKHALQTGEYDKSREWSADKDKFPLPHAKSVEELLSGKYFAYDTPFDLVVKNKKGVYFELEPFWVVDEYSNTSAGAVAASIGKSASMKPMSGKQLLATLGIK